MRNWIGLAGVGLMMAACTQAPPPAAPPPPPKPTTGESAVDLSGQSSSCADPLVLKLTDGTAAKLTLDITNDGGWCALRLARAEGNFDAGLLPVMPKHGTVFIHKVAGFTRIDYTPSAGYMGIDHFEMKLLPGHLPVSVDVTVKGRMAVPAPANPSPKP
jgi:hypothetical protein